MPISTDEISQTFRVVSTSCEGGILHVTGRSPASRGTRREDRTYNRFPVERSIQLIPHGSASLPLSCPQANAEVSTLFPPLANSSWKRRSPLSSRAKPRDLKFHSTPSQCRGQDSFLH